MMDTNLGLVLLGAGLATAILLCVGLLVRRSARRRKRPRVVEAPNSHYRSRGVQNLLDRERWEGIRIDRLHEVNAEEVRALLARVRANGVRGLAPSDRAFLDRMVTAVGTDGPAEPAPPDVDIASGGVSPPVQSG